MPNTETATRAALHQELLDVERAHHAAVASERRILKAAQNRLTHVQTERTALSPKALLDDQAGDRYLALIQERGQLQQTIALAEHHLKNGWE